jgi:hypothetical protein
MPVTFSGNDEFGAVIIREGGGIDKLGKGGGGTFRFGKEIFAICGVFGREAISGGGGVDINA